MKKAVSLKRENNPHAKISTFTVYFAFQLSSLRLVAKSAQWCKSCCRPFSIHGRSTTILSVPCQRTTVVCPVPNICPVPNNLN